MVQKKLELIFSTTDENGDRAPERHVRHLIAGFAELHSMDGYTLSKAITGYWQGNEEDSYQLAVLCFTDSEYHKTVKFLTVLSNAIKLVYEQDATLLTETDTRML